MKIGEIVRLHPSLLVSMADPRARAEPLGVVTGPAKPRNGVAFVRVKMRWNGKETDLQTRLLTPTGEVEVRLIPTGEEDEAPTP